MRDALLFVISPAKALDMDAKDQGFLSTSATAAPELVAEMKKKSAADLQALSDLSGPLGELNKKRWAEWESAAEKQCVLAMDGPAFKGLKGGTMDKGQQEYLQAHLRVLSGLYGTLRPFDLIRPYRLEMGTQLATKKGKNLYQFWGDRIGSNLKEALAALPAKKKVLVNCASQEYFKSVALPALGAGDMHTSKKGGAKVVTCEFPGPAVHAKKARGMIVRYATLHKVDTVDQLKGFQGYGDDGYRFSKERSNDTKLVFLRQGKGEAEGAESAAKRKRVSGGEPVAKAPKKGTGTPAKKASPAKAKTPEKKSPDNSRAATLSKYVFQAPPAKTSPGTPAKSPGSAKKTPGSKKSPAVTPKPRVRTLSS